MKWIGIKRRYALFMVNHCYSGTKWFRRKRSLLRFAGFEIGEGTKVVGPFFCTADLTIGRDCWIGREFSVMGNGSVVIGDRCDIGPRTTFFTGSHEIGSSERRAGKGRHCRQRVGSGSWLGGGVTVIEDTSIGTACVIAAGACVSEDVPDNVLAAGVPAKPIRKL